MSELTGEVVRRQRLPGGEGNQGGPHEGVRDGCGAMWEKDIPGRGNKSRSKELEA